MSTSSTHPGGVARAHRGPPRHRLAAHDPVHGPRRRHVHVPGGHRLTGLEDPIEGEIVTVEAPHRLVMRWSRREPAHRRRHDAATSARGRHPVRAYPERLPGAARDHAATGRCAGRTQHSSKARWRRRWPRSPRPAGRPRRHRRHTASTQRRRPLQPAARASSTSPSRSAPGLSSQVRSTAGPRPTTPMPDSPPPSSAEGDRRRRRAGPPHPKTSWRPRPSLPATAPRTGGCRGVFRVDTPKLARRLVTARDWSADRRGQAVAAAAAILLLLAMIALLVGKVTAPHPAKPPRTGGGIEGPAQTTFPGAPVERSPGAAIVPATSAPTGSAPAPATSAPSAAATGPQLTARARTEDLTLTSYRVTVTIANPSTAPSTDWTVVIVLPLLDLTVRDVDGAVMSRTGLKVIFTPVTAPPRHPQRRLGGHPLRGRRPRRAQHPPRLRHRRTPLHPGIGMKSWWGRATLDQSLRSGPTPPARGVTGFDFVR